MINLSQKEKEIPKEFKKIAKDFSEKGFITTSSDNLINQKGGLSGKPIADKSTAIIKFLHEKSNGSIPIIGVGGIMCANDAIDKIKAGASLIQLYSGFVYSGPSIVKQINTAILKYRLNQ